MSDSSSNGTIVFFAGGPAEGHGINVIGRPTGAMHVDRTDDQGVRLRSTYLLLAILPYPYPNSDIGDGGWGTAAVYYFDGEVAVQ